MKRVMNEIEALTFEGVLKLSELKWGKKYTMGITDILYLHHLQERKICGNSEDDMKSYLLRDGHSSNETLALLKRYKKVKNDLFEYSFRTQSIMDRMQEYGNTKTITYWEQVGNLHMGIIQEDKGWKVVDISQGKEKLLARINEGVHWLDTHLSPNQMNYITKTARMLKQTSVGPIL
ncbi:hypothetical protein N9D55_07490 [Flavobacteriaceae bacterium]|nr:hypothetical protein [Flavobacteriaceae bacterium]